MSDYQNPNLHRGDGVSGRSILVALLAILGVVVLLALAGSFGGEGDGTAPAAGDAVAPATETAPVPTE